MKLLTDIFQSRSQTLAYLAMALLFVVPACALMILGLVYLWHSDGLLWFILLTSLAATPLILLVSRRHAVSPNKTATSSDTYLNVKRSWSERDKQVWSAALKNIGSEFVAFTSIQELQEQALDQWKFVANRYTADQSSVLHFSLPEALLVLEVISREYRRLLMKHVPASKSITLSQARKLHSSGVRWYGRYENANNTWRIVRPLFNPLGSIASELRSSVMDTVLSDLSSSARSGMQRLLMEEVSQVAIELYSGRLRVSDSELNDYLAATATTSQDPILPPMKIALVGQVNAGKSTLINVLKGSNTAATDVLPCTASHQAYQYELADGTPVELIDNVGLDGSTTALDANLSVAIQSDLILLLSAANQPAKAAEKAFVDAWNSYFEIQLNRVKPQIILVSTHNDKLHPQEEWHPPYDILRGSSAKARSMRDALEYLNTVLSPNHTFVSIPVSLKNTTTPYNLEVLRSLLSEYAYGARSAQLNRLRMDAERTESHKAAVLKTALQAGKLLRSPLARSLRHGPKQA